MFNLWAKNHKELLQSRGKYYTLYVQLLESQDARSLKEVSDSRSCFPMSPKGAAHWLLLEGKKTISQKILKFPQASQIGIRGMLLFQHVHTPAWTSPQNSNPKTVTSAPKPLLDCPADISLIRGEHKDSEAKFHTLKTWNY